MTHLTVCIPAHPSGALLLRRTLVSLKLQDAPAGSWEVIVAADDGDSDGILQQVVSDTGARLVDSPRTGGDLPHRNHARNAAARAGKGRLVWFLDADFLVPPWGVRHVIEALASTDVISPCLSNVDMFVDLWERRGRVLDEAQDRSHRWWRRQILALPAKGDPYSGFPGEGVNSPKEALVKPWPNLLEGMPALSRDLYEAVGGFDERFLGWGGNKEIFTRTLIALPVQVCLLRSVTCLHQPHLHDPRRDKSQDRQRYLNRRLFGCVLSEMKAKVPWFQETVERIKILHSSS